MREAAIDRIQQAMVDDFVAFEELDERFAQVYRSETSADLELALRGIPQPTSPGTPVLAHHPARRRSIALIGDAKVGGWISVGARVQAVCVIGDAIIDLSTAEIPEEGTTVEAYSAIGDVRVILPDGAAVETHAFTLIGGRSERLTRPLRGGPRITVRIYSLIGDVQIYSLSQVPEGWLRRLWKTLRGAD